MASSRTPESGSTLLSVVIVNYRSWPDVLALVSSLAISPAVIAGSAEIVVVDNASGEPVPPSLLASRPGLRLLMQDENSGFAAGVNAGCRASRGAWLLVLNPDLVADLSLIERVLDRIEKFGNQPEGEPGIVGFGLRNPDGSRQPSVGVFPSLPRTIWEQLIPRARRKYQPDWCIKAGEVDWVTGACMLLNRRMLDAVGGMDEEFFLYHEEVALCQEAHRQGWRVEYDPGVSVVHLRPLQNRPISPKMRVITRHSKLLYFRKHLPGWQFETLVKVVRLEARVRGAWSRHLGNATAARSWRAIDRIARELKAGTSQGGRSILELAEATEATTDETDETADDQANVNRLGMAPRQRQFSEKSQGTRPLRP